jgi:hypothetical protein
LRIRLSYIIFFFLILAAGASGLYYGLKLNPLRINSEEEAVIIVDRIEQVHKLILVESYFSEIYDYKDYWLYDLSPFRKKALIRVNAQVLAGFDLEKASIVADSETRTLTIKDLPYSEILSVDHELDYYDIQQGTFNYFDDDKITELSKSAKEFIVEKAKTSGILEQAELRKEEFLNETAEVVRLYGWELQLIPRKPTLQ